MLQSELRLNPMLIVSNSDPWSEPPTNKLISGSVLAEE